MTESIQTLIAAIEADFLTGKPWAEWSERALLESASPPPWLAELYEAESSEAALAALYRGLNKSGRQPLPLDQTGLRLGFLYLRHLRGESDVAAFLSEAGRIADAGNYGDPDCEAIYGLLNEFEGCGGSKAYDPDTFTTKLEALFSEHAALARVQLSSLRGAI